MVFLILSATLMVVTAVYHSVAGERRVVRGLLALDDPLMANPLMRKVVRVAWHMASYFMAVFAAVILWPGTPPRLILVVGLAWFLIGTYIFVAWRGRHRGSWMLMLAGALALAGALS